MIKSIAIKNYRGIKDLEIDNFKKYNFFIGDNGSKKTTILESLGVSLSVLNFTSPLIYMLNRQIKVKNENISSLFFNSDINNKIEFILKADDALKLGTTISIDSILSEFQEYSSNNQIDTEIGRYLYTMRRKIEEENIQNNIYLNKKNQISFKNFKGEEIPENFQKIIKKYKSCLNISDSFKNISEATKQADKIIKSRKKELLLKYLRTIDKDIIDIHTNDEEIFIEKDIFKEFVPISSIGDGIVLVLEIIISLILTEEGFKVILIDEIERGIYYKNYRKLSEIIIDLCKNNQNIQLFITTHSKEFLEAFNEALLESEKDNFSLFSLRNKKEKLDVVHYTSEELKDTLETGWDPR
ncbi:AAA family ATPase [Fusobacterium animalis]|uniref:AAA family ATPase n=1 Tax=Fusobacterium animalis TaxID=76859 RepID=UPI0030CDA6A0